MKNTNIIKMNADTQAVLEMLGYETDDITIDGSCIMYDGESFKLVTSGEAVDIDLDMINVDDVIVYIDNDNAYVISYEEGLINKVNRSYILNILDMCESTQDNDHGTLVVITPDGQYTKYIDYNKNCDSSSFYYGLAGKYNKAKTVADYQDIDQATKDVLNMAGLDILFKVHNENMVVLISKEEEQIVKENGVIKNNIYALIGNDIHKAGIYWDYGCSAGYTDIIIHDYNTNEDHIFGIMKPGILVRR